MSLFWFSGPVESKYSINSQWKLTPPFQVPSTTVVVSFSAHPLSTVLQYKFIMLFTFIDLFHKVHSHHIFTFMSFPWFWPVQLFLQTGGKQGVTQLVPFSSNLLLLQTIKTCIYLYISFYLQPPPNQNPHNLGYPLSVGPLKHHCDIK
jgi:hypothetical protein